MKLWTNTPFVKHFPDIPLGGLRYFEQTGSTNDVALAWAAAVHRTWRWSMPRSRPPGAGAAAAAGSLRRGRRWHSAWYCGPFLARSNRSQLFSALGALAVCDVLAAQGLHPEIKWPNDVLLNRRKVCGILAESVWMGEKVDSIVLGIGLNIKPEAVPPPTNSISRRPAWRPNCPLPARNPGFRTGGLAPANPAGCAALARPGGDRYFPACLGKTPGLPRGTGGNLGGRTGSQDRAGGWPGAGWESAPAFSAGAGLHGAVWGSAPASGCVIYFLA